MWTRWNLYTIWWIQEGVSIYLQDPDNLERAWIGHVEDFFEIGTDPNLFDSLEISDETAFGEQYMGKYPVISIGSKDMEGTYF